jgi:hypothetical protein
MENASKPTASAIRTCSINVGNSDAAGLSMATWGLSWRQNFTALLLITMPLDLHRSHSLFSLGDKNTAFGRPSLGSALFFKGAST